MVKSSCEEYGPLISAMIDDELSSDELANVKEHLESCGACRQRAEIFGQLTEHAPSSVPPVPRDWRQRVDLRARRRRRKQRLSWALTYTAAAAVLLAMIGAVQHFRSPQPQPASIGSAPVTVDSTRPRDRCHPLARNTSNRLAARTTHT